MDHSIMLDELKTRLNYNPVTGVFKWRPLPGINGRGGQRAGTLNEKGYRIILLCGKLQRAHRLAWLYTYGVFPNDQIDHINRDRDDNRIENLRDVTGHQNQQNSGIRKNNSTGAKGVTWHKTNQGYAAQITRNGTNHYLGTYPTVAEASAAYDQAERSMSTHAPTK